MTETTTGNLVVELDGRLVTPPVSCGLLPGTFRGQLLDDGAVTEQVLHRTDVERVTAAWMVNSVRGWVPMTIDATISPDPVADRAAQHQP